MLYKNKLSSLIFYVSINFLLASCNGQSDNSNNITKKTSNQLSSSSLLKNVDFDTANHDNNLWVNETNNDVNEASTLYIMPYNSSGYSVELVGCEPFDNVDSSGLGDLNGSYPEKATESYWLGKGYPEAMPDSSQLGGHKIFYNKPKVGSFNCYYRINVPQTMDSMYIKLVSNNYDISTPTDIARRLNYPETYAKNNQSPWISNNAYLASTLLSSGYAVVLYNGIMFRKSTRDMAEVIQEAQDKVMMEFVKVLNGRISEWRVLNSLRYSEDPTIKPNLERWNEQFTKDIEANYGVGKNPFFEIKDMHQFSGRVFDGEVDSAFYNGQIKFNIKEFDENGKVIREEEQLPRETDFSNGKLFPNAEDVLKENNISELDPEAWAKVSGKGVYADLYKTEYYVGAGDKRLDVNIGNKIDEALDFGIETSASKVAGAFLSEVVSFVATQEIMDFVVKGLSHDIHGVYTNGENHLSLDVPTPQDVANWNSSHPELLQQIQANTQVTHVSGGPNAHSDVFSFNANSGNNQQITVKFDTNVSTEPFNRPNAGSSDDIDPYLGKINGANKYDAVVSMYITSNNTDADKILNANAQNDALLKFSLTGLSSPTLPAPVYSLTSFMNLKSRKNISLNNLSLNKLSNNGLEAIVINPDYETTLNVSIPKSQLDSSLLSSNAGLYGTGFIVNYVDENTQGADLLNNIQSDTLLSLYSKVEAESPTAVSPYLYSKFECNYPTPIGSPCKLKLKVGGMNDGQKHIGKLYVADGSGGLTAIPVYMNYRLLSEPFSYSLNTGDNQVVELNVANLSATAYKTIDLSNLPENSEIVSNTCNNLLNVGDTCQIKFNFKDVSSGNYVIKLNGNTDKGSSPSDTSSVAVNISGGW